MSSYHLFTHRLVICKFSSLTSRQAVDVIPVLVSACAKVSILFASGYIAPCLTVYILMCVWHNGCNSVLTWAWRYQYSVLVALEGGAGHAARGEEAWHSLLQWYLNVSVGQLPLLTKHQQRLFGSIPHILLVWSTEIDQLVDALFGLQTCKCFTATHSRLHTLILQKLQTAH